MSDNLKVAKECAQSVSKAIDDYIDSYEFRGDAGDYTPNETEVMLITDAIMGLLEDDDFKAAYTSRILASQQAAHDAEIARIKITLDKCDRGAISWLEALREIDTIVANAALSAGQQQVPEWERKQLEAWALRYAAASLYPFNAAVRSYLTTKADELDATSKKAE